MPASRHKDRTTQAATRGTAETTRGECDERGPSLLEWCVGLRVTLSAVRDLRISATCPPKASPASGFERATPAVQVCLAAGQLAMRVPGLLQKRSLQA